MVRLNQIYTRTGDDGTTGLGTGERRSKADLRVEAYGAVDEANAAIGLARLHSAGEEPAIDAMLARIQNDLFDLGADLCTPEGGEKPITWTALRIAQAQSDRLEQEIDAMNASLPALKSFVLPGGTPCAAALHLARTTARRAERCMVALSQRAGEIVSPEALRYINRLSDHLFVASRVLNHRGGGDILWVPGENR
ncbi:cob(I)yrinic acid a,c-diamide adenosyltransferase [Labrys monachus]|uniref:Corrinoid adenosyltransferase n=1 Tax=Labrys monachus TaxID=217067 RepID=A0ABU0FPD5_9HYPH|nr:cob(I)yrinic acid a,c-diamide adenosyltransferase [Labrys monachus]MDQ0396473.1 cob(I)alamin adenosyltransferase [Labrys monachus]